MDSGLLFILKKAFELFFDDSEEEEENVEKQIKIKNLDYAKDIVPQLSDTDFKQMFRINQSIFDLLVNELFEINPDTYFKTGRPSISTEKRLLITLCYLGSNLEGMKSVADRFGISTSNVLKSIITICNDLIRLNHLKKYINFSTVEEAKETSDYYFQKTHLKGVIGCIDKMHIPIRAPKMFEDKYVNTEGIYSVLLQGVCDHKMKFLHCHAGEGGSANEMLLLKKSGLESKINSGEFIICDDQHLFGSPAYPLNSWLIIPYANDLRLEEHKIFNSLHDDCRKTINRAFGLLKGRFRRLFHIDSMKLISIVKYIMACCIIHNICIQYGDIDEDFIVEMEEKEYNDDPNVIQSLYGSDKREDLMNNMI